MPTYNAYPIMSRFHNDKSFVRCVLGPIGSGKSVGMCAEIVRLAKIQEPKPDGIRYTRTAIVRNTTRELRNTTIKTWLDWYGHLGTMRWTDLVFYMEFHDVKMEILFLGLDRPDQLKSLLSLELSYCFVNEAKEIHEDTIQTVISRLGRYPAMKDGVPCTFPCLIMDSNFPDDDSFIYKQFEEKQPEGWKIWKQPGGLEEDAENIEHLPPGYYTTMMAGKPDNWLKVYRDAQYAPMNNGKAVYGEYNDNLHCIDKELVSKPDINRPIVCGVENGRTSAVVFGQVDTFGRLVVFDEILSDDIGAVEFGRQVKIFIQRFYPDYEFRMYGDPATGSRTQLDDNTQVKAWNKIGLPLKTIETNKPELCVEALKYKMITLIQGYPAVIITSRCITLRKGLNGGYEYKRINVSGERYAEKPDKGKYSHVCFTAGTKIGTKYGSKNIEDLKIGDFVTTPLGLKKIVTLFSKMEEVININGTICTKDHPFYTLKGYVKVNALEYVTINERSLLWKIHWLLKEQDVSIKYILLMVKDFIKEGITMRMIKMKDCILKYGSFIMEKLQQSMIFTIKTLIGSTIKFQTSNVCMKVHTISCIWSCQEEKKQLQKIFLMQEKDLISGIKKIHKKEEILLLKQELHQGNHYKKQQKQSAVGAIKNMNYTHTLKQEEIKPIARDIVSIKQEWQVELMIKKGIVSIVEIFLYVINILKRKRVQKNVHQNSLAKQKVYNIEVEDAHCYYADGYLVSNCNALEYLNVGIGGLKDMTQRSTKSFKKYVQDFNAGRV